MSSLSKSKKFIFSVTTLILCLFVLSGVTLALFTSKDDGKIGINVTSGKLKVDIVDVNDNTLVGDVLEFVSTKNNKVCLFEPGATFHTQGFKIKNSGNITMNFYISISQDEDFNDEKLKAAFDFWVTTDPNDPTKTIDLLSYKGSLAKDETSEIYYLVAHMKQSAGNEFKNQVFTGVGITVNAVQGNVDL
ncbi:MAG: hypothetical protein IJX17_02285 [Clostridia bacterium]|nr:hypothetical protein [Clostridia bacterium]